MTRTSNSRRPGDPPRRRRRQRRPHPLTARGLRVTQIEALPEVLPTVDPELGALVHAELRRHGVEVLTGTAVTAVTRSPAGTGRLCVEGQRDGETVTCEADLVLVVVGVRPDTDLAAAAGARLGIKGAIDVDERMCTGLPGVYAAGDCVVTHHQLLGTTWLPLGTTAHKQGRVAGENALAPGSSERMATEAGRLSPCKPQHLQAGQRFAGPQGESLLQ